MRNTTDRANQWIYTESLSSSKTRALFLALMLLFAPLCLWRLSAAGPDLLAFLLGFLALLFLFYTLNFRTLVIHLSAQTLTLRFGLFHWTVHLDNVETCRIDEPPFLQKYGGAGIHYMLVRGRYRVSFNLLEYPRLVIALKRKAGLVQDVSFSTRHPDELLRRLSELASLGSL